MTKTKLLLSAPVRAILVLLALIVVLGPMLLVASIWGVDASVATVSQSWLLLVIVLVATVFAFIVGALIAYVGKLGAGVRMHAAIILPKHSEHAKSLTDSDVQRPDSPLTERR